MKKFLGTMAIVLMVGLTTGCPDDTSCSDCSCDPSLCDGGNDADTGADADADSDVPTGSLTVTSTPVQGATIEIDGSPTGQITNYTFSSLATGAHSVLLSMTGRLAVPDGCTGLPCPPASVNVTTTGTDVNIFLGWDLSGSWRREVDGEISVLTMVAQPPDDRCPNTWLRVINVDPVGTLCLEGDDTLSLCKTHASSCGDLSAEGRILDNGRRVEFTMHDTGGDYSAVYTKQ
jgi:hypothetical protein